MEQTQQDSTQQNPVTAASRYQTLETERLPFLTRAREASQFTIPSLLPPEGATGTSTLFQPYQSTGAEGVTNLAAKVTLALFPPGGSFFRYSMDDFVREDLAAKAGDKAGELLAEMDAALGKMERAVTTRMEQNGSRTVHYEAILHLIVAGNGLLYVDKRGRSKFFPLSKYVVKRDTDGNVIEIVAKESVAPSTLSEALRKHVEAHEKQKDPQAGEVRSVDIYTRVLRVPTGWTVEQEVCGKRVEGSEGKYPADKCAWIPLRWNRISGEDYGRGRVEEFIGDLKSLDKACKSILEFASVAAKVVMLVKETGITQKRKLHAAKSGDVIDGDRKDVDFLSLEKGQDFSVVKTVADDLSKRVERGFLMFSSVQRMGERVTAEEIRVVAGELDAGLGGVYSLQATEFQLPYVVRVTHQMQEAGDLPRLPNGTVNPQVVTGVDGLGRSADLQRLDALISGLAAQFGPEEVAKRVNLGAYAQRRATALGISVDGLFYSDEQLSAQSQQQQTAEMMKAGIPNGVKAISDHMLAAQQPPQAAPAQ